MTDEPTIVTGESVGQGEAPHDYTPQSAFIEFGSTSIKFYLVTTSGPEAGQVAKEIKVPWDLGYDVFMYSRISPSSVERCLKVLQDLQARFPRVPFEAATAVGTAALREAQNATVLQRVLWEGLNLKIRIIEGGIEAFLLETGFRDAVESYPTGLFDLGGGSVELVEYLTPYSTKKTSLPIGAIRLHCDLRREKDLYTYVKVGRQRAARVLREHLKGQIAPYVTLIGTGGTVRTIVKLAETDTFGHAELEELIQEEIQGDVYSDLSPHRRKVLLPGLLIVESLFTTLNIRQIAYKTASVKRGLIHLTSMLPGAMG